MINVYLFPLFSESKPIPIINNKASSLHGYCSSFITNLLQTGFLLIIMHCLNFRHWLDWGYKEEKINIIKNSWKIRTGKTIPLRVTRQKASSTLYSASAQNKVRPSWSRKVWTEKVEGVSKKLTGLFTVVEKPNCTNQRDYNERAV